MNERKLSMRESYAARHPGKFSTFTRKMSPTGNKPRTALRKVSTTKAEWNRRYAAEKARRIREQIAERGHAYCQRCNRPCDPDGAHIDGQAGAKIMEFFLLDRECHDWCHQNGRVARAEGWIK